MQSFPQGRGEMVPPWALGILRILKKFGDSVVWDAGLWRLGQSLKQGLRADTELLGIVQQLRNSHRGAAHFDLGHRGGAPVHLRSQRWLGEFPVLPKHANSGAEFQFQLIHSFTRGDPAIETEHVKLNRIEPKTQAGKRILKGWEGELVLTVS